MIISILRTGLIRVLFVILTSLFLFTFFAQSVEAGNSITIKRGNQSPPATIWWKVEGGATTCAGEFIGAQYPVSGDNIYFNWTQAGAGIHSATANLSFNQVNAAGTYVFRCTHSSDPSEWDESTMNVNDCPFYGEVWNGSSCVTGYTLTVTAPTNGTITGTGISCPGDCTETVPSGTNVSLTAGPSAGYALSSWGGDCTGTTNPCSVAMTQARTVSASFVATNNPPNTPTLVAGPVTTYGLYPYEAIRYDFRAIDPDGDQVRFRIDQNNDGSEEWILPPVGTGYVNSGVTQFGAYTWNTPGVHSIAIRAEDVNGALSSPLIVNVTLTIARPVVTLPTHTSVTTNSATLGATLASKGGTPTISARGTCWGTMNPPPTAPSPNCIPDGGADLGAYSHARTGLPPGTTIYYWGYATNIVGTGYSPISSFPTGAPLPDLFSVNTAPAAAATFTNGQSIAFTGTAQNTAAAAISQGGWADLEIDWNSDGVQDANYNAFGGVQLGAFTPSQSKVLSYTLPAGVAPIGTHQYRFNVDVTNVLAEGSNEGNNRSTWSGPFTISANPGPTTNAGVDRNITLPTDQITIPVGGASATDPDGVASTVWSFVSGPGPTPTLTNQNTLTPTFSVMTTAGAYTFRLTATDSLGASNADTMVVNVGAQVFGCTGSVPGSAAAYDAEESTNVTVLGTSWAHSASDTATKCQFRCNTGYAWTGGSCVLPVIATFVICDSGMNDASCQTTRNVPPSTPLTVRWTSNTDSCSGTGFSTGSAPNDDGASNITASSLPGDSDPLILICTLNGVPTSRTVTLNTNEVNPTLTVSPRVVQVGDTVDIQWNTNNPLNPLGEGACTLTGGGRSMVVNAADGLTVGSIMNVMINARTTFRLDCGGLIDLETVDIIPQNWET